jgi:hypothetical protein
LSGEEFDSAARHLSLVWYRPCTVATVVPSMNYLSQVSSFLRVVFKVSLGIDIIIFTD